MILSKRETDRLVHQTTYAVKREVIHAFLSELGIARLEEVLKQAKENRKIQGHNDYTTLAEVWLNSRRKPMTTTTTPVQNPFRRYSKLHAIFHFISDGQAHNLAAITDAAYSPGAGARPDYRRRTSSAIRTIRATLEGMEKGTVLHYSDGTYCLNIYGH